jgi:metal-sulfur cluster biosynthetic enzyme
MLRQTILEKLSKVIDPETGVDVVRMRLIEDLMVDGAGRVAYKFRPSSPLCPIAIPLSIANEQAVAEVEGVTDQQIEIVGFALRDELMNWLNRAMRETGSEKEEL